MKQRKAFIYFIILFFVHSSVVAQDRSSSFLEGLKQRSSPSEYIFQEYPDQKLITVRLLGGVQKPGIYRVPKGTSLVTLLSLSGGVRQQADSQRILLRSEKKASKEIVLEKVLTQSKSLSKPAIKNNDVVFIPDKEPAIDQDTLTVTTFLSSVVGIALSAAILTDRVK